MYYAHRNEGVNEKKPSLPYEAPGLDEEPMLTLGCPISKSHNPANQSQSSKDKGKHVDSLDEHLRNTHEIGSLKREPRRHENLTPSSSSMSNDFNFLKLNQYENMLDGEENGTMPSIESAQRSVRQKLDDHGRNATSTSVTVTTQDSGTQPERQQCEVVLGDIKHVAVEDACQSSESSYPRDICPPFGGHNFLCPRSLGTNAPEGFQVEMESMNQVQIDQDVLGNEKSRSTQDSPHQEHAPVKTASHEFKGWMEDIMRIGCASQFQWPKWTVSYLLDSTTDMETLITYYRILNLANDLNDEDLRLFLEEQLDKETAGLSEDTIKRRLRTAIHGSSTALTEPGAIGDDLDTCSICMGEFKDSDRIASLYYCPHEHHADCISKWLLKSNACPLCRALAIIPEQYPDWNGDIRLHRAFFVR